MNTYRAAEFEKTFPDTFANINKGLTLGLAEIMVPVRAFLRGENMGSILLHGSFMRIVDTDADTTLYVEINTAFKKVPSGIARAIYLIRLYDSLEGYDAARLELENHSRLTFGDESVLPPMRFENI